MANVKTLANKACQENGWQHSICKDD